MIRMVVVVLVLLMMLHYVVLSTAIRYWMGKEQKLLRFDEKDPDLEAMHEALWTIGGNNNNRCHHHHHHHHHHHRHQVT